MTAAAPLPPAGPAPSRSTTRRLDHDPDLLDVAGADGVLLTTGSTGLAGRGGRSFTVAPGGGLTGREGALQQVTATLSAIASSDDVGRPGCGPVAFVAIPFAPGDAVRVTIPELLVGRDIDGTRWITRLEGSDIPVTARTADGEAPGSFTVAPGRAPAEWCDAVADAVSALRGGEAEKVVLARDVLIEADRAIDRAAVLRRLRGTYPSALLFAVSHLVGASPELLVSRAGDVVRSHPMAGTVPRTGDPTTDARRAAALLASAKDRAEHQITIDVVLDTLLPFCSYVDSEPEPSIVTLANVQHLASLCEGRLSSPPASVLSLAAALHPTPAVCGWPREPALGLIERLERLERGLYAGAVGWVDAAGNGRFAVAIRCAEIEGRRARLLAGNGIVADSDPGTELEETRAKLQAMLAAVVRP